MARYQSFVKYNTNNVCVLYFTKYLCILNNIYVTLIILRHCYTSRHCHFHCNHRRPHYCSHHHRFRYLQQSNEIF